MDYDEMRARLITHLNQHQFVQRVQRGERHTVRFDLPGLRRGTQKITLSYPGYKSSVSSDGRVVYDFRVDVCGAAMPEATAISHVNLIADICWKVWINGKWEVEQTFYNFLCGLAQKGCDINPADYGLTGRLKTDAIGAAFLENIEKLHGEEKKIYNRSGNAWGYSLDELCDIIPWIVLQEDLNYPMPKKQGRRMPFYRYMEAVYCAAHPDGNHRVSDVMLRALAHHIPPLWTDAPEIPYMRIASLAGQ